MTAFFTCDEAHFPIVVFEFNQHPMTDTDFENFLNTWEGLYRHDVPFKLVFNTTNMTIPNPKYCIKMAMFIKKIRTFNPQHLQVSYISVQNSTISNLLECMFYMQPPVAPVHITLEQNTSTIVHYLQSIDKESAHNEDGAGFQSTITKVILPSKPFWLFL